MQNQEQQILRQIHEKLDQLQLQQHQLMNELRTMNSDITQYQQLRDTLSAESNKIDQTSVKLILIAMVGFGLLLLLLQPGPPFWHQWF